MHSVLDIQGLVTAIGYVVAVALATWKISAMVNRVVAAVELQGKELAEIKANQIKAERDRLRLTLVLVAKNVIQPSDIAVE